jgi:hypothetical protein
VLASPDLGFLLSRCDHVALREGEQLVVLEAEKVIHWRALQVATATPYLPGVDRLRAQFPGLRPNAGGLVVPIRTRSPEDVLAECLAVGIQVAGSRIVYSVPPESEPDAVREPFRVPH